MYVCVSGVKCQLFGKFCVHRKWMSPIVYWEEHVQNEALVNECSMSIGAIPSKDITEDLLSAYQKNKAAYIQYTYRRRLP